MIRWMYAALGGLSGGLECLGMGAARGYGRWLEWGAWMVLLVLLVAPRMLPGHRTGEGR